MNKWTDDDLELFAAAWVNAHVDVVPGSESFLIWVGTVKEDLRRIFSSAGEQL